MGLHMLSFLLEMGMMQSFRLVASVMTQSGLVQLMYNEAPVDVETASEAAALLTEATALLSTVQDIPYLEGISDAMKTLGLQETQKSVRSRSTWEEEWCRRKNRYKVIRNRSLYKQDIAAMLLLLVSLVAGSAVLDIAAMLLLLVSLVAGSAVLDIAAMLLLLVSLVAGSAVLDIAAMLLLLVSLVAGSAVLDIAAMLLLLVSLVAGSAVLDIAAMLLLLVSLVAGSAVLDIAAMLLLLVSLVAGSAVLDIAAMLLLLVSLVAGSAVLDIAAMLLLLVSLVAGSAVLDIAAMLLLLVSLVAGSAVLDIAAMLLLLDIAAMLLLLVSLVAGSAVLDIAAMLLLLDIAAMLLLLVSLVAGSAVLDIAAMLLLLWSLVAGRAVLDIAAMLLFLVSQIAGIVVLVRSDSMNRESASLSRSMWKTILVGVFTAGVPPLFASIGFWFLLFTRLLYATIVLLPSLWMAWNHRRGFTMWRDQTLLTGSVIKSAAFLVIPVMPPLRLLMCLAEVPGHLAVAYLGHASWSGPSNVVLLLTGTPLIQLMISMFHEHRANLAFERWSSIQA
eukprot:gene27108-2333_t